MIGSALRSSVTRPLNFQLRHVSSITLRSQPAHSRILLRLASSSVKATRAAAGVQAKAPPKQFKYPEVLCIYHAGALRVTSLAWLKLSAIFLFAFFGFVATPKYYEKEGWSTTTIRTAVCALVPIVFVTWSTSPFVSYIHLRLTPFARQSEANLRQFMRNLSKDTELAITTTSAIAKPRVSQVLLSELKPAKERLGIVNYIRDTTAENEKRKWYQFRAQGKFNVQQQSKAPKAPWAWAEVAKAIGKKDH
ncbi:hypothetical protein BX600DRAFT_447999 [Xylariales sp. PMI_506]|nr:hypothetical protein BX600DRAFT_447999 [Xylariales sp. PMI_506]